MSGGKFDVNDSDVERLSQRLSADAEKSGYHINPDRDFARALARSLLINEKRYGYQSCPCRLASGKREEDLDIICPCDYRDPDLNEFGCCFCALYVTREVVEGRKRVGSIPERRPTKEEREKDMQETNIKQNIGTQKKAGGYPVWRCKVCGYLCARDQPPDECPICKASKDRFERFDGLGLKQ